jgi:hypothetical protein
MKKFLVIASFVTVTVASPAHALQHQITPLQPTELTCSNLKGTWQYNANWEPLFDAAKPPDPVTRKRPFLLDSTGKPWPTYQVTLVLAPGSQRGSGPCTVPNGGMVNCGGATRCSILVTCPVTASGAYVGVQGTGNVVSTAVRTVAGRKPANCS